MSEPFHAHHGASCAVCFIIPPRVLKRLSSQAQDPKKSDTLLETLALTEHMRGQRTLAAGLTRAVPAGELRRTIYDAHRGITLPGKLVMGEGGPTPPGAAGVAAKQAYDNSGLAYKFYKEVFGRNSVDDRGMRLDSTVHFAKRYDNALWNGQQMVYGDGDFFHDFTAAFDVIAHELTHGVTQYTVPGGGLVYQSDPGALNESMSDCFAIMAKHWHAQQTAGSANWAIGDTIVPTGERPLRSLSEPEKGLDPQPKHMSQYVDTPEDHGGVHINSGIANHAFYLTCMNLGAGTKSWETPGKIWYRGLSLLRPLSGFQDAAQAFVQAAGLLHGPGSKEAKAVTDAWAKVGVLQAAVT